MKRILLTGLAFLSLWITSASAATGPFFNVSTQGSQLTINTIYNPKYPHHVYPRAGIRANTPGFSLANNNCLLSGTGYCLFTVSDIASYTATISGPSGAFNVNLCLNGNGPLTCGDYRITGNRFAYLGSANYSSQGLSLVEVCPMEPMSGVISTSSCLTSAVPSLGQLTNYTIHGIAFNNAGTRAYVALFDADQIQLCSVDQTSGTLYNCVVTALSAETIGLNAPSGIVLNTSGTFAYIANASSSQTQYRGIISCAIERDTGALVSCNLFLSGDLIDTPGYIAINQKGNYLYITSAEHLPHTLVMVCLSVLSILVQAV